MNNRALRGFLLSVVSSLALLSCSSATDVYRVGRHGWIADSIYFRVYETADSAKKPDLPKITLVCRSCNFVNPPTELQFDANGSTRVYIPEAINLFSARLHLLGKGIDTTFIQKQRSPQDAQNYYRLAKPLIGRILVTQLAMLYADPAQDTVIGNAQTGDEINIFDEDANFFQIHYPPYDRPVYLLRSNAVRLQ